MIDQAQLASWAPDVDENNPSQIADSDQVFPTTKGIKSFSIPVKMGATPKIVFVAPDTSNSTWDVLQEYYPPPMQSYTAYWPDGSSTLYVLTEKVRASYFSNLTNLAGTAAVNGAIFVYVDGAFTPKAYVNSGDIGRTAEPSTVPVSGPNNNVDPTAGASAFDLTFDFPRQYTGSFAQYGNYCFVATGNELVYFTSASKTVPDQRLSPSSQEVNARFVAQAGDFLFLANSTSTGNDDGGVPRDSTYWICSGLGVLDANDLPDFNLGNTAANRCESSRLADTPGPIVGAKALDRTLMLYKERAVYMIADDGSSMVQQTLSTEAGALCDNAVVDLGGKHVFVGNDDFYFVEGQAVQTLPNPCKEFLLGPGGDLDKSKRFGVRGQHHKQQTCVYWYYPSMDYAYLQPDPDEFKPVCDKWICWNYTTDSWTRGTGIQVNSESKDKVAVFATCSPDLDTSQLNAVTYLGFGTNAGNDIYSVEPDWNTAAPYSWSSALIAGSSQRKAAVFGALTSYSSLESTPLYNLGSALKFKVDTSLFLKDSIFKPFPDQRVFTADETNTYQNNLLSDPEDPTSGVVSVVRSGDFGDGINFKFVRAIRPRFVGNVTPTSIECTVYVRQQLSDDWKESGSSFAGQGSLNADSPFWFSIRSNSRYHQFKFTFTGSAELSGYDIDYDDSGTR